MDKIYSELSALGEKIMNDPYEEYQPSYPYDIGTSSFIGLLESIDNNDFGFVVGLLFNSVSFISSYFSKLSDSEKERIWQCLSSLCTVINFQPGMQFLVDLIELFSLKCHAIYPTILSFLGDVSYSSFIIKPFLLISLFDYLPPHFMNKNQHIIMSFIEAFQLATISQKSSIIHLVFSMHMKSHELVHHSELVMIFWQFGFELASGDDENEFLTFSSSFKRLFLTNNRTFENSNSFISEKLNELECNHDDISILGPLFLLSPFFALCDIDIFFSSFLSMVQQYITSNLIIPPLLKKMKMAIEIKYSDNQIETISNIIRQSLNKKEDEYACIFLFSVLIESLVDIMPDAISYLTNIIITMINQEDVIRSVMYLAISQISYLLSNYKRVSRNQIFSNILKTLSSESFDLSTQKCALKALKGLVSNKCINSDTYCTTITDVYNSIHEGLLSKYFKVIGVLLDNCTEQGLHQIHKFINSVLYNDSSSPIAKARSLEIFVEIANHNKELFIDSIQKGLSIINDLFNHGEYTAISSCGYFIKRSLDCYPDGQINDIVFPLFEQLLCFAKGIDGMEDVDSRFASFFACKIVILLNEQDTRFDFPIDLVSKYIDSSDYRYVDRGIYLLGQLIGLISFEEFLPLYEKSVKIAHLTELPIIMNDTFKLTKYVIKKCDSPFSSMNDLIQSTIQGRLKIFSHVKPYDYDGSHFKFYSMLKTYVRYFDSRYLDEIIDWLPRLSGDMLSKAIEPINEGIRKNYIAFAKLKEMWNMCNDLFKEFVYLNNEEEAITSLLSLLLNIRQACDYHLDSQQILNLLFDLWDLYTNDNIFMYIIPPAIIEIISTSSSNMSIQFDIVHSAYNLVAKRQCDWDFPSLIDFTITMYKNNGDCYKLACDQAVLLAHFLVEDNITLQELGFDEKSLANLKEGFKMIIDGSPQNENIVLSFFSSNKEQREYLEELLSNK